MTEKTTNDRLLCLDVSVLNDDALFDSACAALTPSRLAKTGRMKFRKDKNLSAGVGLLLRRAMLDTGIPDGTEPEPGKKGKLYFPAYPQFCFNLSHSGTVAVCAVSPCSIGCDIEVIDYSKPERLRKIASRFFQPHEEQLILSGNNEKEQAETFFRFWTLKESFMKVTGEGMSLAPDTFGLDISGTSVKITQNYDSGDYRFREFRDIPGYALSVCTEGRNFEADPQLVELKDLI